MSETTASLRRKISGAGDLQSVVRTMKALSASSIGQYEQSVRALGDYYRAVELGLGLCLRSGGTPAVGRSPGDGVVHAVVFGSDQGLVGQFNEVIADFAVKTLADRPGTLRLQPVGERVHSRLADQGLSLLDPFAVPGSVQGITPLVGQILAESEAGEERGGVAELHLIYNRPSSGAVYAPVCQRVLPLDREWSDPLAGTPWPSRVLPEVLGDRLTAFRALVREYLFMSLFRACAESLASENASRLAAMQRAEKNIQELLEDLKGSFHELRQSGIDAELFDVITGFEALA